MGLDVRIRLRQPIVCPDCGKTVYNAPVEEYPYNDELNTCGHCLRSFLNDIGYGDEQYGQWFALTDSQAFAFARTCIKECCDNAIEISIAVMTAEARDFIVELEADW